MLQCRPLTGTFGAEIQDIQLTADMDDATFNEVRQSWADHELLLFRGQNLSEDDLIAFSRRLGKLEIHVRQEWLSQDHPEVLVLSNMKVDGKSIGGLANSEINWHYDQIYLPRPAVGSLIFSVAIPLEGGATYFADMCGAYDALPSHLKSKIEGRQAVQSYDNFNTGQAIKTKDAIKKKTPDVTHPIVRVHPITGRPALYVCPGMTTLIVGLDEDESRAVLDELFTFSTQPEFIYRHDWQIGDAILWDNACTMHRRDDFDDKYDRLMKRTTILPPEHLAVPV